MKDIHDYKESTITLQLGEAIAENRLDGIQEMWSQGRKIIGKIRNNLLELKTYRDTRDYGYDEQNDITKEWTSVKKALINGEIPEFAKNHPKETKENKEAKEEVDNKEREKTEEMEKTTETMTNSENHLKETKENKVAEEEVEMKEREKMTMDEILSEGEKYMEEVDEVILVEDTPQEEVATLPLLTDEEKEITESKEEVEITQSDNWWTQYLVNDDDAEDDTEDDTQFNDDLDSTSPIEENSEFVMLCKRNGYKFEAVVIRNEASNTIQSCAIYAVEESTGRRLIDANGGLSVSREKIMNTENYKVMNFMRKFDVNFNEDDLKTAFYRLKGFIEISKSRVDSGELSIEEAFDVFQQLVIQRANAEEKSSSITERNYIYNAKKGYIQVRARKFQQALDDADTGFKRKKFLLGLRMLEKSTGQVIIKGNRSKGYGFVDSNSQSWFRFTA